MTIDKRFELDSKELHASLVYEWIEDEIFLTPIGERGFVQEKTQVYHESDYIRDNCVSCPMNCDAARALMEAHIQKVYSSPGLRESILRADRNALEKLDEFVERCDQWVRSKKRDINELYSIRPD
ncbi:hypothetical protein [Teredinibacter sp. KSP-S5-2]|uniref:hypothetical protein n=1 Tax=Teredinibacter sp. KSP-S5-2 TaxID=3034506 RepID=UPI002934CD64|nr:hypothetical protein [Teredinibacter sp. KSP-S5-2]WNO10886.1 hypothetical protein P5V12_06820 [Teredinibacter sp. KSP-S5-2]